MRLAWITTDRKWGREQWQRTMFASNSEKLSVFRKRKGSSGKFQFHNGKTPSGGQKSLSLAQRWQVYLIYLQQRLAKQKCGAHAHNIIELMTPGNHFSVSYSDRDCNTI